MRNCYRPQNGPISGLSNEALLEEWGYWNFTIRNAESWGARIGVADEFRTQCEREIARRNMRIIRLAHAAKPSAEERWDEVFDAANHFAAYGKGTFEKAISDFGIHAIETAYRDGYEAGVRSAAAGAARMTPSAAGML